MSGETTASAGGEERGTQWIAYNLELKVCRARYQGYVSMSIFRALIVKVVKMRISSKHDVLYEPQFRFSYFDD